MKRLFSKRIPLAVLLVAALIFAQSAAAIDPFPYADLYVKWCSDDAETVDYLRFPEPGERYLFACIEVSGDNVVSTKGIEAAIDAFQLIGPDGQEWLPVAYRAFAVEAKDGKFVASAMQREFGFIYLVPGEIELKNLSLRIDGGSPDRLSVVSLGSVLHIISAP